MSASFDLSGRIALITGATRGLGFESARALNAAGAHVLVNGRSGETVSKYAGSLSRDIWVFDPTNDDWSHVAAPATQ